MSLTQRFGFAPATVAISAINILVFAAAEYFGSTRDTATLLAFGASQRDLIWSGQYYRFVTPMFLHIGIIHLAWNTSFGFSLCAGVEAVHGWRKFLISYLGSGIGGIALGVLCHDVVSAGASTALFGMIGIGLVHEYRRHASLKAFFADSRTRKQLGMLALWFALGFVLPFDNYGHGGGLFFGILFGLWLTSTGGTLTRMLQLVAVLACLLTLVVAAAIHWPFQTSALQLSGA